jgi:hypothetical protein
MGLGSHIQRPSPVCAWVSGLVPTPWIPYFPEVPQSSTLFNNKIRLKCNHLKFNSYCLSYLVHFETLQMESLIFHVIFKVMSVWIFNLCFICKYLICLALLKKDHMMAESVSGLWGIFLNYPINFNKMDGAGGHPVKWNKPDTKRQILHALSHVTMFKKISASV